MRKYVAFVSHTAAPETGQGTYRITVRTLDHPYELLEADDVDASSPEAIPDWFAANGFVVVRELIPNVAYDLKRA